MYREDVTVNKYELIKYTKWGENKKPVEVWFVKNLDTSTPNVLNGFDVMDKDTGERLVKLLNLQESLLKKSNDKNHELNEQLHKILCELDNRILIAEQDPRVLGMWVENALKDFQSRIQEYVSKE